MKETLTNQKSNVFLGIIGAFIGAAIGSVLWVGLYQVGIIASIAGIAIAYCANKGYTLLGKGSDRKAVIISFIISLLVVTLVNFLCWSYDIYKIFVEEYNITFWDAVRITPDIIFNPEFVGSFMRDAGIGYVLMIVGCWPNLRQAFGRVQPQTAEQELAAGEESNLNKTEK